MSALIKSVRLCSVIRKSVHITPVISLQKRSLRVEPEDEIERYKITKSFDERVRIPSQLIKVESRDIGASAEEKAAKKRRVVPRARLKQKTVVDADLERKARSGTLAVPIDEVENDFLFERAAQHTVNVAKHYNIFEDLFLDHHVHFTPDSSLELRIAYELGDSEDTVLRVHTGNKLELSATQEPPLVGFSGKAGKQYSLFFINLDGHLTEEKQEYMHWYSVNMGADDGLSSGQSCNYLPPIPLRGTGFHRYVYVMLEHQDCIDAGQLPNIQQDKLSSRSFSFAHFFNTCVPEGTVPVGLQFFQSEWDDSVTKVFYETLDMQEPGYAYDYPVHNYIKQKRWPHNEAFQTYLDRYRDRKDLKEEVLVEHLSEISPFLPPEHGKPLYPLSTPTKKGLYAEDLDPTWMKNNQRNKALGIHKYQYVNSD